MKNSILIKENDRYGYAAYEVYYNGNAYGYIVLKKEGYQYRPFEYYHPLELLDAIAKFIKEIK